MREFATRSNAPEQPGYRGDPWFLPIVGSAYRLRDWVERRLA